MKPPRHSIGSASKDTATRTKSSRTSVSSPVAAKKHPTEEGHREKRRRVEPGARNDTPLTAQSSASQVIPIIDRQQAGKDFTISQLKQILASREHLLEDHEFMEHDFAEHLHREVSLATGNICDASAGTSVSPNDRSVLDTQTGCLEGEDRHIYYRVIALLAIMDRNLPPSRPLSHSYLGHSCPDDCH